MDWTHLLTVVLHVVRVSFIHESAEDGVQRDDGRHKVHGGT